MPFSLQLAFSRPFFRELISSRLLEQSLRQSLIMSNGHYMIFLGRPIALGLLLVSAGLLVLSAISFVMKRKDWRTELAEAEAGEVEP